MPLDPPTCSGPIGSPTRSCLKRFVVHFRRPSPYKGEYGFDWLRDEYVYPIERVNYNHMIRPTGAINANVPLCSDPAKLRVEYKAGVLPNVNPYNKQYYPAWLSIFPTGTANGSIMHKNGVNLYLQLDEIDAVIDDGTEIYFEPANDCLKIKPNRIPISEFIAAGKKTKNLGAALTLNYYELKRKLINIKCQGKTLSVHTEIKIMAKLGTIKKQVGQLMVYNNDKIPYAKIVTVDVITSYTGGNPDSAKTHPSYEYLFKRQSFNQALIRAEVHTDTVFDIVKLAADTANADAINFLNYCNTRGPGNIDASRALNEIVKLYNDHGKYAPTGTTPTGDPAKIDTDEHKDTYLFFTKLLPNKGGLGQTTLDSHSLTWGNAFIIFGDALKDDHTIVHEAGHSFSLFHSFEDGYAPHVFYHGYTENYMDYTWNVSHLDASGNEVYDDNKYKGNMYSFFKWQWDIMRRDRSID